MFCWVILDSVKADDSEEAEVETPKVDDDVGKSRDGSRTDDEVVQREEEAINIDGLSVAEMKQMRESSEKHAFQAEVSRMTVSYTHLTLPTICRV